MARTYLLTEKAILDELDEFKTMPPLDCTSGLQRSKETARIEQIQYWQFFSHRFTECWFLYDLFVDPLFEDSADELLQWGLDVAQKEVTCLGTFQPTTSLERFICCGFTQLDRFQICCQEMMYNPEKPGETLPGAFGAGGIYRNVLRNSRYLIPPTRTLPSLHTFRF